MLGFTNKHFRIARVFGVDIEIDISWFVIAAIVVWIGSGFYSGPLLSKLAIGVLFAGLFFFGLFLHEFSHSVVSKLRGINVSRMRFGLLGAAAFMEHQPRSPKDEFLIGVAGPLTSFLVAFGFLVLHGSVGFIHDTKTLSGLVMYLVVINAVIGLFNSLPAYPLDGGRFIARAILWQVSGNALWSMRWASRIGELFGKAMIFYGVVGAVLILLGSQALLSNPFWFILLGFFLANAARGSYLGYLLSFYRVRDCMRLLSSGPIIKDYLYGEAEIVSADSTLDKVIEKGLSTDMRIFHVEEDGKLVGTISPREIKEFIDKQK